MADPTRVVASVLYAGQETRCTSAPSNVEETARGLRAGEYDVADPLLRGLRIAPLGRQEGSRAGEWRREHAARGLTLAQADCLVAAAAHSVRARLATGNPKDFPMPDVPVEHWAAGA